MTAGPIEIPYQVGVPVLDVTFRPIGGGSEYRAHAAMVDSGAAFCWVPWGTADSYGWVRGQVPNQTVHTAGADTTVECFPVHVRCLHFGEIQTNVCEFSDESSLKDLALVGRALLKIFVLTLHGPLQRLQV